MTPPLMSTNPDPSGLGGGLLLRLRPERSLPELLEDSLSEVLRWRRARAATVASVCTCLDFGAVVVRVPSCGCTALSRGALTRMCAKLQSSPFLQPLFEPK